MKSSEIGIRATGIRRRWQLEGGGLYPEVVGYILGRVRPAATESWLIKMLAYATLTARRPDLELAKEVLDSADVH